MAEKDISAREQLAETTLVCAIGASAGGIAALQDFFAQVPSDLGVAFVVTVPLSPDHPSRLSGMLAERTRMPVHQVQDTPRLEPNCVYVIPPDRELVIRGGDVQSRPSSEPRGGRAPVPEPVMADRDLAEELRRVREELRVAQERASASRTDHDAVARLRDSEERFRALVSASHDAIFQMSADWTEMRHLDSGDFVPETQAPSETWVARHVHRYDQPLVREAIRRAIETRSLFELEHRVRRADGTIGWSLSRAVPLFGEDGEVREWFGAASDVTERRRNEEQLRETRDLLALATAASHLGWGTWTDATGEALWDDRAREILGLAEDETRVEDWLDRIHPEGRPAVEAQIGADQPDGSGFDIVYRVLGPGGTVRHVQETGMFKLDGTGASVRGTGLVRDVTELKSWEESQRLLVGELNHRVKNMLAVVQAIARQTQRHTESPAAFVRAFERRIQALAQVHSVLVQRRWSGAGLRELTESAAASFIADRGRIRISGPAIELSPNATISFSMALHELGTNALKHGALSEPAGVVEISWSIETAAGGEQCLRFVWEERGGPEVSPPARSGFGSSLLERGIARELGGAVSLRYEVTGLVCTMEFPIDGKVRIA